MKIKLECNCERVVVDDELEEDTAIAVVCECGNHMFLEIG